MSNDLRWFAPMPPDPEFEVLEVQQVSYEFYAEVRHRQEFECYCQWYYNTAQQHQQEHQKLQRDFNFMGWFNQSKG